MRIGFDAKRAFFNQRGLGNYSRDTIRVLSNSCLGNQHFLYVPRQENRIAFDYNSDNCHLRFPEGIYSTKWLSSWWRTSKICKDIEKDELDIYHGLSHELPYGIEKTGVKTVVTMHDVIFLKNPELFPLFDRYSFKKKYIHGCRTADRIIAVSEQTKSDLVEYMGEKEERIDVVYQGCNPMFHRPIGEERLLSTKQKYNLPSEFMLIVCAVERRKNHELILKAMRDPKVELPLVVVGRPSDYQRQLQTLVHEYRLEKRVLFFNDVKQEDLPAIYKLAKIFVYPSLFEGFGIPIIEAMTVGTPVITSKGSCFKETGGDAARYVSTDNADELSEAIISILSQEDTIREMREAGFRHVSKFSDENIARNIMNTYKKIV